MLIKNKRKIFRLSTLLFVVALILFSCQKEIPEPEEKDPIAPIKSYIYAIMNDIYYWYRDIPRNIKPAPIKTVQEYYDTLIVPTDRWSWMMTGEEYISSETGVVETYGASLGQPIEYYQDYSIRVRYVHPESPLYENGVRRGYQLTHLNGTPVMTLVGNGTFNSAYAGKTNEFTFVDYNNNSFTFTASARDVHTKSYLKREIYTSKDYPGLPYNVGYFNYLSFKKTMLDDIKTSMVEFETAGIKELILDLRYNGGGDSEATSLMANYLAPPSAHNKILARREHNDKYSSWDSDILTQTIIQNIGGSLRLNRLIILTSKASASASEVLLNGLKPLMNVIQIGATTYGKPNGMYVLAYPEGNYEKPQYVFLPICFFSVNSEGKGHYVNGIEPDHYRADDLYHDFGLDDDLIKSSLYYIVNGSFPSLPPKPAALQYPGQAARIKLPEERPDYGIYTSAKPH